MLFTFRRRALAELIPRLSRGFGAGGPVAQQAGTGRDGVIGSYTPVTKKLWMERIRQGIWGDLGPPGQPVPKKPRLTAVAYPFREDFELKEQVGWAVRAH